MSYSRVIIMLFVFVTGCASNDVLIANESDSFSDEDSKETDSRKIAEIENLTVRSRLDTDDARAVCTGVYRDLSIPWNKREYWCKRKYAVSKSRIRRHSQHIPEPIIVMPSESGLGSGKDEMSSDKSFAPSGKTIWFTKGLLYLEEKGLAQVESLVDDAIRSNKILLKGFLLPGESDLDNEVFSVGRSLAVKKRLVELGVDESIITIQHYSDRQYGQYVKVVMK